MKTTEQPPETNPFKEGAATAQRLGANRDLNPHPVEFDAEGFRLWNEGFDAASARLNELFLAWLALGHSIPKLALGASGQALGPMVAGLVASNGNTAGALLVGALCSHAGKTLAEILPPADQVRECFESTQYGITGHELDPKLRGELPEYFFNLATEIDRFRESESDVEEDKATGKKFARVKFDLAQFLKVLVEGLPAEPAENLNAENVVDFKEGGAK